MNPTQAVIQLQELGWTQEQIAYHVRSKQPTINGIAHGSGTRWDLGDQLVRLARSRQHPPKRKRA